MYNHKLLLQINKVAFKEESKNSTNNKLADYEYLQDFNIEINNNFNLSQNEEEEIINTVARKNSYKKTQEELHPDLNVNLKSK